MFLYRGDNRAPEVIKRDGFSGRARYVGNGQAILKNIKQDIIKKGKGTLAGLFSILRGHTPDEATAAARHIAGASYGSIIYYFKIDPVYAFEFTKDGIGGEIRDADFDNVDCLIMSSRSPELATTVAVHHSAKTAATKEVTFYTIVKPGCISWYTQRPAWNAKPEWKKMADIVAAPSAIQGAGVKQFKDLLAKFGK
jgi:hypothetical protein